MCQAIGDVIGSGGHDGTAADVASTKGILPGEVTAHIVSVSEIGALVGDPAHANMLEALLERRALTASELASRVGVAPQTESGHLAKPIA